ncbi:MAG: Na(+)-translocating NADH-quinone reductase subunit C [Planctomycetota bacterium]
MPVNKDKGLFIVFFATAMCVVCSAAVSSLAVALREKQTTNKRLDKQKNILRVAGLLEAGASPDQAAVEEAFKNIEAYLIDRKTGERVEGEVAGYDQRKAAKTDEGGVSAESGVAKLAQVKRLPNTLLVYEVTVPGKEAYILPISGNGLWSTLLGFIAVKLNAQTIAGITYYEHAETPGLGGEVDNPKWKALWPGRQIYGPEGDVRINANKGGGFGPDHDIDALSGATITSHGVTYMLQLWLGPDGYQPFLKKATAGSGGN